MRKHCVKDCGRIRCWGNITKSKISQSTNISTEVREKKITLIIE